MNITIIVLRYLLAILLGMLPVGMGLKEEWYVIHLVTFNFVLQIVIATIQMIPYFKGIKYLLDIKAGGSE